MKIRKKYNNKMVNVDVRDSDCNKRDCLVISSCNLPNGKYSCRIRDVGGCPPESKLLIK